MKLEAQNSKQLRHTLYVAEWKALGKTPNLARPFIKHISLDASMQLNWAVHEIKDRDRRKKKLDNARMLIKVLLTIIECASQLEADGRLL